jgi:hypothetical protein
MEQHTTNESVKTGLQIEGNSKPDKLPIAGAETETSNEDALKETDADEQVHEESHDTVAAPDLNDEEQDMDEIVHSIPASKNSTDNGEADPDDLVHQK